MCWHAKLLVMSFTLWQIILCVLEPEVKRNCKCDLNVTDNTLSNTAFLEPAIVTHVAALLLSFFLPHVNARHPELRQLDS